MCLFWRKEKERKKIHFTPKNIIQHSTHFESENEWQKKRASSTSTSKGLYKLPQCQNRKRKKNLLLDFGDNHIYPFLEADGQDLKALGSEIGTCSIFCHSFSLSNNMSILIQATRPLKCNRLLQKWYVALKVSVRPFH